MVFLNKKINDLSNKNIKNLAFMGVSSQNTKLKECSNTSPFEQQKTFSWLGIPFLNYEAQ